MIAKENIEIGSKDFVKQYSDGGFYIERDGEKYSEAIDPAELNRVYTETDELVETDSEQSEAEQKAAAFDYITGRGEIDE